MATIDVLSAFDADGDPLVGLTPTWAAYEALDGSPAGSEPTIEAVGGGQYRVLDMPVDRCGIVDLGASAEPRYVFVGARSGVAFGAFDLDGEPLAGLVPTWDTVRTAATGVVVSPEPSVVELADGLYRVDDLGSDECGILDLGESANPRHITFGLPSNDSTSPSVANVTPSSGTTIGRGTSLQLEVTDAFPGLRRVVLLAKFSDRWEVVHDGDDFGPQYSRASLREAISGGFRFTISRVGGWPSTPTILPIATDQSGNENA